MKFSPLHPRQIALLLLSSCGRAPTAPAAEIDYGKHRDLAGLVAAILVESATMGNFDEFEVDSPSVVKDPARGSNVPADRFLLFYEGTDVTGMPSIGLVTSNKPDFSSPVIDREQVFAPGPPGTPWEFGATDPSVLLDQRAAENIPGSERRYKMWFEALSGTAGEISTIVYCDSADGSTWSTPVAVTGLDDALASVSFNAGSNGRIVDPVVVLENPDGGIERFLMWFEVVRQDPIPAPPAPQVLPDARSSVIGFAESLDGIAWTVRDAAGSSGVLAAPLLLPRAGSIDGGGLSAPGVALEIDSLGNVLRYHLWYEAQRDLGTNDTTIGYARSTDLQFWERFSLAVLEPSSDSIVPLPFDSDDLKQPTALIEEVVEFGDDGPFLLWYGADEEDLGNLGIPTPNRIGYAHGQ